MLEVIYNDKVYTGEDRNELLARLHQKGKLSTRKISSIVSSQIGLISHETVRSILMEQGVYSPVIHRPELNREETFISTDEEIASRLGIPVSAVIRARKKFDIKSSSKASSVNLHRRRILLAQYLFGCNPGSKFTDFLLSLLGDLPEKRAEIIEDFYVKGLDSTAYHRVYRDKARKQLKEVIKDLDREFLIENDIIAE